MELKPKHLLLAAIPTASLAFASWGSATIKTLYAVLWAPSFSNGIQIYDCNHTVEGRRYHFETVSTALDNCGKPGRNYTKPDSYLTGSTVGSQFDDTATGTGCGVVTQHSSQLYSHEFDSFGQDHVQLYGAGSPSGCWNSNVNTGQCCSASASTSFSSSTSQTNGSCSSNTIQGVSTGTTP